MGIIAWLVFGGLAGWVASMIMKKNNSMGILANIVVGIVGAFVGGFLMDLIGQESMMTFNLKSFLVAVAGSVILLAIINLIKRK
jgi:uncharacterized membrane protein YeaQ/YmgE (transglycosylase-associated protein family)